MYYHSRRERTWEQLQWKITPHFSKFHHYWKLTNRLFGITLWTLVYKGLLPLQRFSRYSTAPANWTSTFGSHAAVENQAAWALTLFTVLNIYILTMWIRFRVWRERSFVLFKQICIVYQQCLNVICMVAMTASLEGNIWIQTTSTSEGVSSRCNG